MSTKSSQKKKSTTARSGAKARYANENSMLEPRMKNDLVGVGFVVLGIILFIMLAVPVDAIVTNLIAGAMRLVFGWGAFLVAVALVIWGVSFFLKDKELPVARLAIGIGLIVLSCLVLMALLSLGTVSADQLKDFGAVFSNQMLMSNGGGYVGSIFAWALVDFLGFVIAYVIVFAFVLVGAILVGFSVSGAVDKAKSAAGERRSARAEKKSQKEATNALPAVKKGKQPRIDEADIAEDVPNADETILLGEKRGRKFPAPKFISGSLNDEPAGVSSDLDASDGSNDKTLVLPAASKRRGAKTTRLSTKAKRSLKAESADLGEVAVATQQTIDLKGAEHTVIEGSIPAATEGFTLPSMSLLKVGGRRDTTALNGEFKQTAQVLQKTLEEFNLPARVVGWLAGPTVTLFKVELPSGVKLSKLTGLADDIALALAASSVRIAQIPNTSLVGVEIPNKQRQNVFLGDIITACGSNPLDMAIGEDIDGNKVCKNLAKMPHLLIGGTTGSGKSVCINSMIMSIIMRSTPAQVRMVLIDPKRIEFSQYNGIPHLYVPVVTEPKEAASALRWGVVEMERRLKVFEGVGARNIGFYNQKVQNGELDSEEGERPPEMPYIVIVIDELSDLMMAAGKDVEDSIVRISQLARAAGIHLIVATQRPSSNVVTGMIKANITNRIALLVATGIDSRVILDSSGAEKLVGNGDMLFGSPEWGKPKRIQGCYVSDEEILEVVAHLKEQGEPEYHPEILQVKTEAGGKSSGGFADASDDDPLLWEAADAVVHAGLGSTSMLQRRLKVGYARAGRIMDMLENKGIVGPADGSRAREVLIDSVEDLEAIKAFEMADREG